MLYRKKNSKQKLQQKFGITICLLRNISAEKGAIPIVGSKNVMLEEITKFTFPQVVAHNFEIGANRSRFFFVSNGLKNMLVDIVPLVAIWYISA